MPEPELALMCLAAQLVQEKNKCLYKKKTNGDSVLMVLKDLLWYMRDRRGSKISMEIYSSLQFIQFIQYFKSVCGYDVQGY